MSWEIKIKYNDVGTEDADYPDEEIELLHYTILNSQNNKTKLTASPNKRPSQSSHVVCCTSALEAWATVLY